MPGLPKTATVTMTYAWGGTVTASSGVIAKQTFRANSIHDPDSTGVGHQALGHDQWKALYTHYLVTKSRIRVTVCSGLSQTVNGVWGVYLAPEGTVNASTYEELIEQGKSRWGIQTGSIAAPPQTRYLTFDAKKEYNLTDVKDNQTRIGGTFDGNPSEMAFFVFWFQPLDQSTTGAINMVAHIEYTVDMSEPVEIVQS